MEDKLLTRAEKYAKHFEQTSGLSASVLSIRGKCFYSDPPSFCVNKCPAYKRGNCDFLQIHLRNCLEAEQWDGRYTYYCPADLMFMSAHNVSSTGIPVGVVTGPIILDEMDRSNLLGGDEELQKVLGDVATMSTSRAYHVGETLAALLTCCGIRDRGFSPTENRWDLINKMFEFATAGDSNLKTGYPIELERRLQYVIQEGDKDGALQQINILISYIYLSSSGNLESIKSRMIELLTLVSRAAIDGGAEANAIFLLNEKYFREMQECTKVDDLGVWLAVAVQTYASYVLEFPSAKHSYAVFKAINHIKQNYAQKITLEETAKMVFLSKSYFSKLFAEETGTTFSNYIINVRIEKSKQLLLDGSIKLADVAYLVGFVDQSYFTKCFRKQVGVSPGKFRNNHGKIE
ncbi:MAG: AraC family transcriptional regulator [Oscillospiraceae bacterium]|nr:AraC family transcriptional regulator [Oscillospiraceae bacterium]